MVTVSSAAHSGPPFDFDDPNFETRRYRRTRVYQQSKLANVLFTHALARRLEGTNVEAVALHPGVYDTGLLRDYMGVVPGGGVVAGALGSDAEKAAPILAGLAVGRRDEDLSGTYLDKGARKTPSKAARDPRGAGTALGVEQGDGGTVGRLSLSAKIGRKWRTTPALIRRH